MGLVNMPDPKYLGVTLNQGQSNVFARPKKLGLSSRLSPRKHGSEEHSRPKEFGFGS
jgi:hypothetical protein